MPQHEGRWDCTACGKTNLGRYKSCVFCGAAKGNARNYLPSEAQMENVTDPALLQLANAGPDWVCASCKTNNPNFAEFCTNCGAGKDGSKPRETHVYSSGNVPRTRHDAESMSVRPQVLPEERGRLEYAEDPSLMAAASTLSETRQGPNYSMDSVRFPKSSRVSSSTVIHLAFFAVILAVVIGAVFFITRTHDYDATISFSWSRTIHVDSYQTVRESAWAVPPTGRLVSTGTAINHYNHVYDHTDHKQMQREVSDGSETYACGSHEVDEGNGFFSDETDYCTRQKSHTEYYTQDVDVYKDDPVYAPWYTYDIDKWVPSRDVVTSGASRTDPAPVWGELTLVNNGQPIIGAERENSREEHYYVAFAYADNNVYRPSEMAFSSWSEIDQNRAFKLVVNNLGVIVNDPLAQDIEK